MSILLDVLIIIFFFFLFALFHSVLASRKIKVFFSEKYSGLLPYYRLLYNIVSFISFYIVYSIVPKPDIKIYDLNSPWDLVILIPQFLSLAGILWTIRYFDLMEFLGVEQILKRNRELPATIELDGNKSLHFRGPYRLCRHPLYFFIILFLVFRPTMTLFYLTAFICISIYFYIGSYFEEEKLVEDFGESYINYQKTTPRIIPFLHV